MFFKIDVLKNFAISPVLKSLFNKGNCYNTGVFCEYRESLKKRFFYRTHPALAGSVVYWVFKGYLRYKTIFFNKVALAVY